MLAVQAAAASVESPVDEMGILTVLMAKRLAKATAKLSDEKREAVINATCEILRREFAAELTRHADKNNGGKA
jgi:hypothetical protein